MSTTIPPDVAARLIQAATELMSEQGFEPLTKRDAEIWMGRNLGIIRQRAVALFAVYLSEQHHVIATVSESVYRQIRKGQEL